MLPYFGIYQLPFVNQRSASRARLLE